MRNRCTIEISMRVVYETLEAPTSRNDWLILEAVKEALRKEKSVVQISDAGTKLLKFEPGDDECIAAPRPRRRKR